jgi:hypothetical protein
VFVGEAAFSRTTGEVRFVVQRGDTLLTGDTDGDGRADFTIRLTGTHALTARDVGLEEIAAAIPLHPAPLHPAWRDGMPIPDLV